MSAIDEGLEIPKSTLNLVTPLYQHLYRGFRQKEPEGILPDEPEPPDSWTNYSYEEYEGVVSRYVYDVFLFLVVQELRSKGAVNSWTPPSPLTQWLASALEELAAAAPDVVSAWRDEGDYFGFWGLRINVINCVTHMEQRRGGPPKCRRVPAGNPRHYGRLSDIEAWTWREREIAPGGARNNRVPWSIRL